MLSEARQQIQVHSVSAPRDNCSAVVAIFNFRTSLVLSSTCHLQTALLHEFLLLHFLLSLILFNLICLNSSSCNDIVFYNVFSSMKSILEYMFDQDFIFKNNPGKSFGKINFIAGLVLRLEISFFSKQHYGMRAGT